MSAVCPCCDKHPDDCELRAEEVPLDHIPVIEELDSVRAKLKGKLDSDHMFMIESLLHEIERWRSLGKDLVRGTAIAEKGEEYDALKQGYGAAIEQANKLTEEIEMLRRSQAPLTVDEATAILLLDRLTVMRDEECEWKAEHQKSWDHLRKSAVERIEAFKGRNDPSPEEGS